MRRAGLAIPAVLTFFMPTVAGAQAPLPMQPGRLPPGMILQQESPPAPAPQAPPQSGVMYLSAVFADGSPIRSGLVWRIFEDAGDGTSPTLIKKLEGATPTVALPPGNYVVHAAYGFSSASRRVTMQWSNLSERLVISAGALSIKGIVGDSPIPPSELSFSVYVPVDNDPEGRLVVANARGGEIVRLPEGTYHVVSTYGDANAIMRSDIRVEAGKVTEATLNHRAAVVTLKLVAAPGGEAFAGTSFSVLTPGGDVIREAIGAFPSVTLAEGEYVLIARHDGQVFTREFEVASGLDRDIEVIAKSP